MLEIGKAVGYVKIVGLSLEIGCGQSKKHPVRVDFSANSAANVICNASYLPFQDMSFSFVYSKHIFEHLANPRQALEEWMRVLLPSGRAEIITDNASYWRFHVHLPSWMGLPNTHQDYSGTLDTDQHVAIYFDMHLYNHLKCVKLKNVTVQYAGFFPLSLPLKWIGLSKYAAAALVATGEKSS